MRFFSRFFSIFIFHDSWFSKQVVTKPLSRQPSLKTLVSFLAATATKSCKTQNWGDCNGET